MLTLMSAQIQALKSLSEPFKQRKSFVVSFRMRECEPCDYFEALFEQAQRRFSGTFDIYYIHCDDEIASRMCSRYNVSIAPTAAMFNSRRSRRTPVFLRPEARTEGGIDEFLYTNVYYPFREVNATELHALLEQQLLNAYAAFVFYVFDSVSAKHREIVERYKDRLDFYFVHDYDEEQWDILQDTELGQRTRYDQFNLVVYYNGYLRKYGGANDYVEIIKWIDALLQ